MNIYESIKQNGGSASALSELTDVLLSSPSDGQSLIYDSDTQKWVNGGASASSTPESMGIGYGTCVTVSSTSTKAVTLADFVLTKNGIVVVKFSNAVTGAASLNVNSTGAKDILYRGGALTNGIINANDTATFIYDGTNFHIISVDSTSVNAPIYLTQTLTVGNTTVTFTNSAISGNSVIDVYTDKAGLDYTSITAGTGSVTITYESQSSDVTVMLMIRS